MTVLRLWSYLSVLAVANAMPGSAAPKPSEIVPLYVSTNRPLAMLTIGDSAPMPVVFDTGTTENILDAALAKREALTFRWDGRVFRFELITNENRILPAEPT